MDDNMDMNEEKKEETAMGGMMPEGEEMPADGMEEKKEEDAM